MAQKAPGKAHREGISLFELTEMFPDEASAVAWFESICWPDGERHCGKCGSINTREIPNAKPMPYWCGDCKSYFSVRTGTMLESSRLPLRKWAFATYLYVTSLKGVSSIKLHRDLKVTQKTAWFMLHRLREAWGESDAGSPPFNGPVEADETHVGGKLKNMHADKRAAARERFNYGKSIVAGVKDRETNRVSAGVVGDSTAYTLQTFVATRVASDARVYTDDGAAYRNMRLVTDHESVNHSAGEYVRGDAGTQGIEAFWSMIKRAYNGTYHHWSPKHADRYIAEFAGRHNVRDADTADQMRSLVAAAVGKRLMYRDLIV